MGISEFTVHNVLRTYSRQEHLGRVQRAKPNSTRVNAPTDQVTLSPTGHKVQWVGQLATELVDQQNSNLVGEERSDLIRSTKDSLIARHRDEIGNDAVTPDALAAQLRPIYLG